MDYYSIGRNIRKCRHAKKLRQDQLAEKAGLSTNYIGAIERGEKFPSLESMLRIINALGVSADIIFADVLDTGYIVKTSQLTEKLSKLSSEERAMVFDMIDTMIRHFPKINKNYPHVW